MKKMTLNSVKKNDETAVSNIFLDKYMRDANGEFVKVYLYLLRCMNEVSPAVTVTDIADKLNLTEKDVIRSLKYWAKAGVLSVEFDADTKEPSSITFLSLDNNTSNDKEVEVLPDVVQETAASKSDFHSYSPSQVKRLKEREDIKQLLYIVERYIGKTLSGVEVGIVLFIHEQLDFSPELIEYLVEYCVTNQHTSLRYMEKVATSWNDKGIKTVADAKEASAIYSKRTQIVCKTFGLTGRALTPAEIEFIDRWYDEYGFDKVLISEACKRTILSIGKANFNYTDGTLKKWHSAGVHTTEDLKTLDAGFRAKITVSATNKPVQSKSVNKFNNFSQRSYNFDEIEKNLISNNK